MFKIEKNFPALIKKLQQSSKPAIRKFEKVFIFVNMAKTYCCTQVEQTNSVQRTASVNRLTITLRQSRPLLIKQTCYFRLSRHPIASVASISSFRSYSCTTYYSRVLCIFYFWGVSTTQLCTTCIQLFGASLNANYSMAYKTVTVIKNQIENYLERTSK